MFGFMAWGLEHIKRLPTRHRPRELSESNSFLGCEVMLGVTLCRGKHKPSPTAAASAVQSEGAKLHRAGYIHKAVIFGGCLHARGEG